LHGKPLAVLGDLDVRSEAGTQTREAGGQLLLIALHVGRDHLEAVDRAGDDRVIRSDQARQVGRHLRQVADHIVEKRVLRRQGRRHGLQIVHQ